MPRKPRFFLPDLPVHMVVRGNGRRDVFIEDADYQCYLKWIKEALEERECRCHAYVLMSNHVHLLVSAKEPENISKLSQHIGRKYVPYFNSKYNSSGTLWEGRFKASTIDSALYLLACYRYIELNPVRAGMVDLPGNYRWSSYRINALGERSDWLTPHDLYLALGRDTRSRLKAYQALFTEKSSQSQTEKIRRAVQTGVPLGSEQFCAEIARRLKISIGYDRQGRPTKRKKGTDPFY